MILLGIQISWSRGHKQFLVESDSLVAIFTLLNQGCPSHHLCFPMIRNSNSFEKQVGIFVWLHTLREGNQIAYYLAKFGLDLDRQLRIFEVVPHFLSNAILTGVTFPRDY